MQAIERRTARNSATVALSSVAAMFLFERGALMNEVVSDWIVYSNERRGIEKKIVGRFNIPFQNIGLIFCGPHFTRLVSALTK